MPMMKGARRRDAFSSIAQGCGSENRSSRALRHIPRFSLYLFLLSSGGEVCCR